MTAGSSRIAAGAGPTTTTTASPLSSCATQSTLQLGGVNGPTVVFTPSTPGGLPLADATAPAAYATTPAPSGWVPLVPSPVGSRQAVLAGVSSSFNHFWKSAPSLSTLLPIKAWWESTDWRKGSPLLFLVFGLAPWVILHSVGVNDGISKMAWGFSIYFAVLWALVMYALIRPGRLDYTLLAQIAAGGAIGGIPLAIALEQHFNHGSSLAREHLHRRPGRGVRQGPARVRRSCSCSGSTRTTPPACTSTWER